MDLEGSSLAPERRARYAAEHLTEEDWDQIALLDATKSIRRAAAAVAK